MDPAVRRARLSVIVVFFCLGGLTTSLAPRIPAIKADLHLSTATLGLALLGAAAGLVVATPFAGAILHRADPRRVVAVGFVPFAVALPFVAVAESAPVLFAVLFAWGFGGGFIDVAMNVDAVAIETAYGRSIMVSFHAAFSIGALAGSGLGALAAAAGVGIGAHLVVACTVAGLAGISAVAVEPAVDRPVPAHPDSRGARRLPPASRGLVALAAVALGSFLAEGAANDWSAVYLHSSTGASTAVAGFGYSTFAVTMAGGRILGDRVVGRFGARRSVRWSTAVAAVAFAGALLIGDTVAGLVGLAVLGLGLANVVPQVFASAARLGSAGPSLAVVTGSGYTGLMAGPALIGGLAGLIGLRTAMGTVVVVCALAAVLAGALRDRPGPAPVALPAAGVLVR